MVIGEDGFLVSLIIEIEEGFNFEVKDGARASENLEHGLDIGACIGVPTDELGEGFLVAFDVIIIEDPRKGCGGAVASRDLAFEVYPNETAIAIIGLE